MGSKAQTEELMLDMHTGIFSIIVGSKVEKINPDSGWWVDGVVGTLELLISLLTIFYLDDREEGGRRKRRWMYSRLSRGITGPTGSTDTRWIAEGTGGVVDPTEGNRKWCVGKSWPPEKNLKLK